MAIMTLTDLNFSSYTSKTAVNITTAGTYTFDGCTWDGSGTYEIETSHASGLVTIVLTNGSTALVLADIDNSGGGTVAIQNNVDLEINGVTTGSEPTNYVRCHIEATAGGPESVGTILMNEEAQTVSGSFYKATEAYNYVSDQPVIIRARYKGYLPFETTGTVTNVGLTVTAIWQDDPNYN